MASVVEYLGGFGIADESAKARAVEARALGVNYSFRGRFFGEIEKVDAVVASDASIVKAYADKNIPEYKAGTKPDPAPVVSGFAKVPADNKATSFEPVAKNDEPEVEETIETQSVELFDVYRINDGERGKRASLANVPKAEADAYIAERPDNEYEIVAD